MNRRLFPIFTFLIAAGAAPAAQDAGQTVASAPPPAVAGVRRMHVNDVVVQALALNPEIRFYEDEITLIRERRSNAGRWDDPSFSVEIGRKSSREPGGAFAGDGVAWGVTLAQRFDFSGRNALRKAIAQRQVGRAEAGLAQFRRELSARAAELAHVLLAAQQRLEASEDAVARLRAVLGTLVQREPAGINIVFETRILEAGARKLSREASVQRARLAGTLADLNLLRGLPPETPLVLANDPMVPVDAPEDGVLLASAFRENHTLRQFELDLEEQGIGVELEGKNLFNDVTLSAYYSEEKAGGRDRFAGIGVSIPLPLWNRNSPAIAEAKTRRGQAESALFRLRRDVHKDVLAAAALYRASQGILRETSAEEVARFHEAAMLGERHYRLGAIPVSTYVSLLQAHLETVDVHVEARVDAVRAAAQLSILGGRPLETFFQPLSGKVTPPQVSDGRGGVQ